MIIVYLRFIILNLTLLIFHIKEIFSCNAYYINKFEHIYEMTCIRIFPKTYSNFTNFLVGRGNTKMHISN